MSPSFSLAPLSTIMRCAYNRVFCSQNMAANINIQLVLTKIQRNVPNAIVYIEYYNLLSCRRAHLPPKNGFAFKHAQAHATLASLPVHAFNSIFTWEPSFSFVSAANERTQTELAFIRITFAAAFIQLGSD